MTDPALRDPIKNVEYYRTCQGYEDNKSRFEEPRVKWVVSKVPKTGLLLDAGAGDGFLTELLPAEVMYQGVELNEKAVANAYPKAQGKILLADVMTAELGGPFDCILCLELIEHVPEPGKLLLRLKALLKPTGRLITTSAQGRGEGWEPGNAEHLREFTPAEYYKLHDKAGLVVLEQAVVRVYGERFTNAIVATPGVGPSGRRQGGSRND